MRRKSKYLCALLLGLVVAPTGAQPLHLGVDDGGGGEAFQSAMPKLATRLLSEYREDDPEVYLDNLFRIQLVAGKYAAAAETLTKWHQRRAVESSGARAIADLQYLILARAKVRQAAGETFENAFRAEFRDTVVKLDDRDSALLVRMFNAEETGGLSLILDLRVLRTQLQEAGKSIEAGTDISVTDALRLVRLYQTLESYRSFMPLVPELIREDDSRRYVFERDIKLRTPEGGSVCILTVRPKGRPERLTTLMEFTIYSDRLVSESEARRTASNGYAGVVAFTRGKACGNGAPIPWEHDGRDAAAVIDWVSQQPWSDGRVGMYGGSYSGFTEWSTAKQHPKALKALMTGVSAAPGIDVPMEGGVVQSAFYYWPLYSSTGHDLDGEAFEATEHWQRLFHVWYSSGRPYLDLDKIDGRANPFWRRWLQHPTYDAYWQSMIPSARDFAQIEIPVLTTTGYYDGAQIGALYYFIQHHARHANAKHFLVIGPYDHWSGGRGTVGLLGDDRAVLEGYPLDAAALVDFGQLRYQWFAYVFGGAPKPSLLQDVVNYEVMGRNIWRHSPSIGAMHNRELALHLTAERVGNSYLLDEIEGRSGEFITQTVDMTDRSDADRGSAANRIVSREVDTPNSVVFVGRPISESLELSGLFSAQLDFTTNKRDFDFKLQLYELTSGGDYIRLSWHLSRASLTEDRRHIHLLVPDKPQRLQFTSGRLTSRQLQSGSRLVMVLSICKGPAGPINYGSGGTVNNESIADAGNPMTIRWSTTSVVRLPIRQ